MGDISLVILWFAQYCSGWPDKVKSTSTVWNNKGAHRHSHRPLIRRNMVFISPADNVILWFLYFLGLRTPSQPVLGRLPPFSSKEQPILSGVPYYCGDRQFVAFP